MSAGPGSHPNGAEAAIAAFGPGDIDQLVASYRVNGIAVLRGALDEVLLARLEAECVDAQRRLAEGRLDERHGTTELTEADSGGRATGLCNYVLHITELSPTAASIVHSRVVTAVVRALHGEGAWSGVGDQFGYVYQDARPSAESSYKRIGWHTDWQSSPHLDLWPATAVTVHIDGTGSDNGYLRVVPGSHRWATPAPHDNVNGAVVPEGSKPWGGYSDEPPPVSMPLRFDRVPGEVPLAADPGDVFFHDCYLWHAAEMGADLGSRRRHVRGSWYAGRAPESFGPGDFVKNAAR